MRTIIDDEFVRAYRVVLAGATILGLMAAAVGMAIRQDARGAPLNEGAGRYSDVGDSLVGVLHRRGQFADRVAQRIETKIGIEGNGQRDKDRVRPEVEGGDVVDVDDARVRVGATCGSLPAPVVRPLRR